MTLSGFNIKVFISYNLHTSRHCIFVQQQVTSLIFQGRNDNGQLGHGDVVRCDKPKVIESLKHYTIVQASCGKAHTLVLTGLQQ